MEDLATGRMSVAQIAQRIIHGARDTETGELHDFALVKELLHEEVEDIPTAAEADRRRGGRGGRAGSLRGPQAIRGRRQGRRALDQELL